MDWVKDWWAIITALLAGAMWIGKVQRDVEDLKSGKFVTNERCGERRQEIKERTDLQFTMGNEQFREIKGSLTRLENILLEMKNERH